MSFIVGVKDRAIGEASMMDDIGFYLIIAGVAAMVVCLLVIAMFILRKFRDKIKGLLLKIYNKFVFNGMIRSITIMYIKLCMSFGLQLKMWQIGLKTQTDKDKAVAVSMFTAMVSYPLLCSIILNYKYFSRLQEENIKKRISNLYQKIST